MKKIMYYYSVYKKQIIAMASIFLLVALFTTFILINRKFSSSSVKSADKTIEVVSSNKKADASIKVDVKGAVKVPGVYEMSESDRVIDAIHKAGGLSENAYVLNLNLAKRIFDENVIIVNTKEEVEFYLMNDIPIVCEDNYKRVNNGVCSLYNIASLDNDEITGNTTSISNDTSNLNKFVNINTASKEQISTLEGIGESKALKIIDYRENNGPFKRKEDIMNVEGIGEKLYEAIKDSITV